MRQFIGGVGCLASLLLFAWFVANGPVPKELPAWLFVAALLGAFTPIGAFVGFLVLAFRK